MQASSRSLCPSIPRPSRPALTELRPSVALGFSRDTSVTPGPPRIGPTRSSESSHVRAAGSLSQAEPATSATGHSKDTRGRFARRVTNRPRRVVAPLPSGGTREECRLQSGGGARLRPFGISIQLNIMNIIGDTTFCPDRRTKAPSSTRPALIVRVRPQKPRCGSYCGRFGTFLSGPQGAENALCRCGQRLYRRLTRNPKRAHSWAWACREIAGLNWEHGQSGINRRAGKPSGSHPGIAAR
jgi:hypothetical protein